MFNIIIYISINRINDSLSFALEGGAKENCPWHLLLCVNMYMYTIAITATLYEYVHVHYSYKGGAHKF